VAGAREITFNRLPHGTVLKVRVKAGRRFRIRFAMFTALIKLAAWVLGCGVRIKEQ